MSTSNHIAFHDSDEEFCRSKFDHFLRNTSPDADLVWEDGDEPPDYYFRLNDMRYAVEVTRFMDKASFSAKAEMTIPSQSDFINEIEQIAREKNVLRGLYVVRFNGNFEKSQRGRAKVRSGILNYLENTKELETAAFQWVYELDGHSCGIEKRYGHPDMMHPPRSNNQIKWSADVITELPEIVEDRLSDKAYKLRNIIFPKILLLYDWYHLAGQQIFAECVSKLPSLTSFHTVFIVQSNSEGFVLVSQNPGWTQVGK
jgi:hypothetical protein